MDGTGLVIAAAVINWFVTTIFVESYLFAPYREWIVRQSLQVQCRGVWHRVGNRHAFLWPEDTTEEEYEAAQPPRPRGNWGKVAQLVNCQMCLRTWVGFAEALVLGTPFGVRWYSPIAGGLLYAGAGHLILEARSRVALVLPQEEADAH